MTTVAITDYASLTTAIGDAMKRTYTQGQVDRFIGLAEGVFRLYFGPNFAKDTSTTLTFTSGSATLPTGFVRPISLLHTTYGVLTERSIGTIRERRVYDTSGIPDIFAITGTTVEVAPSYTGNLTFDYEGTLTGLSSGNPTNWLITNAPQAYLSMCLSFAKGFLANYADAAALKSEALGTLTELGIQSTVAQKARSSINIPGTTP